MEGEKLTCGIKEFAAIIGVCEAKAREICASQWRPPMVPVQVSGRGRFLIYRNGIEPWLESLCEAGAPFAPFAPGGTPRRVRQD